MAALPFFERGADTLAAALKVTTSSGALKAQDLSQDWSFARRAAKREAAQGEEA
jgi:hypothetical protein